MHDRRALGSGNTDLRNSPLSRRMFLGAGAAAAAGAAIGTAGPAFADPLKARPSGTAPFGPVLVTAPDVNGSYARAEEHPARER